MPPPLLAELEHLPVAKAVRLLEANGQLTRVLGWQALGAGEVSQMLPHPLVAIYGADGVAAHQQFLRSALAKRLQRQRTGSIGVEQIHDRLLVDGSPSGHRGGRSWNYYVQYEPSGSAGGSLCLDGLLRITTYRP
ncbi:MAG: hypothetical protein MZV70_53850, partial [Desulfobacterales bacterium]|nr:hypothetical protein [Desulfobacterales bacterium]